jgi:hypothetical protein
MRATNFRKTHKGDVVKRFVHAGVVRRGDEVKIQIRDYHTDQWQFIIMTMDEAIGLLRGLAVCVGKEVTRCGDS